MPENLADDYELAKLRIEGARDAYREAKATLAYLLWLTYMKQERFIGSKDADAPKTERARWKELRDVVHLGNYDLRALVAFAARDLQTALLQDDGETVKLDYQHVVDPVTLGRIEVALGREKITAEQAEELRERALTEFWFPEWCDSEVKLVAVPPDAEQGPTMEQIRSACKHLAELDDEFTVERFEEMEAKEREGYGTDCSLLSKWLKKPEVVKKPKEDPNQTKLEGLTPEDFEEPEPTAEA